MSGQPRPLQYARVLSIAGSDSGGGAGVQADLKTFAALGCYGMTAITALTAQNTLGVRSIHAVPLDILADQIDAVVEDIGVDAVKIGMLHSAPTVQAVAAALDRHGLRRVVLDPVMVATSGATLIDPPAVASLVRELFPRALLVTPNLDEASLLVERPLRTESDMEAAARQLLAMGARAVLLKGGHLQGDTVSDLLLAAGAEPVWLRQPRIATPNTHGTGCTLSSAIAAWLAQGADLPDAVRAASEYVRAALWAGAGARAPAGMTRMLPPEMQQVVDRLLAFLAQDGCTDEQFDAVAKQLYAFQYAHDEAYRRFCLRRGVAPHRLTSWTQIPPVPISAFKDATLSCLPPAECERIFMTSGTTRGEVKGRNHHPTIAVWDASMRRHFEQRFVQGAQ
ncbi:MAG: bifunctional hydroxymethylpyrimidine kinase/phosphomethylpyrimidine kinase, partial [Comamonadaceae bacterium]